MDIRHRETLLNLTHLPGASWEVVDAIRAALEELDGPEGVAGLERALEEMTDNRDELSDDLEEMTRERDDLRDELDRTETECASTYAALEDARARIRELEAIVSSHEAPGRAEAE